MFTFANQSNGETVPGVYLNSRLPDVMKLVSASDGGFVTHGAVTWDLGDLPPGATGKRTLVAQVAGVDPGVTLLTHNHAYLEDGIALCAQAFESTTIKTPSPLDKDNDGFPDADELKCGSDPRSSESTCYHLELSENYVRIPRSLIATISARVYTTTRFDGAVTLAADNILRGGIWRLSNPVVNLNAVRKIAVTSITLQTTSGTSLGVHQIPIWAKSGAMEQMKILLVEVVP